MVPGEFRASSSSSSTLRAPSARQGETPIGQELSSELGFLTWMTMLWLRPALSVATTETPVMYVMLGTSGSGVETAPEALSRPRQAARDQENKQRLWRHDENRRCGTGRTFR